MSFGSRLCVLPAMYFAVAIFYTGSASSRFGTRASPVLVPMRETGDAPVFYKINYSDG